MQYINLTPHAVTIYGLDGQIITVPQSGVVARLDETEDGPCGEVDGVPYITVRLGRVDGLPEPQDGVTYIASMPLLMGMAAAGAPRPDVVYPYGQIRDDAGRIIGCRSLARIAA